MKHRLGVSVVASIVVFALSGCSWLFMKHLPDDHVAGRQPDCTTTPGWWLWDVVQAIGNPLYAFNEVNNPEVTDGGAKALVGLGLGFGLLHVASAVTGVRWAAACKRAKQEYAEHPEWAENPTGLAPDVLANVRLLAREEQERKVAEAAALQRVRAAPPGFYCTMSPLDSTIGWCGLSGEICAAEQAKILAAGDDVGPCTATPAAVCFNLERDGKRTARCAPSHGSCGRARAAVGAQGVLVSVCADAAGTNAIPDLPVAAIETTPPR